MPTEILIRTELIRMCCPSILSSVMIKVNVPCDKFSSIIVIELIFVTLVGWLCWGLMSQSTIFQSCRDGAIASWVINQYFRRVKCLAQGHNTAAVGFEPRTSRSGVRHSTTEPPRSPFVTLGRGLKKRWFSPLWYRWLLRQGFFKIRSVYICMTGWCYSSV